MTHSNYIHIKGSYCDYMTDFAITLRGNDLSGMESFAFNPSMKNIKIKMI